MEGGILKLRKSWEDMETECAGCSDMLWWTCATWHDVRMVSGGVRRAYDVCETGAKTWACGRS